MTKKIAIVTFSYSNKNYGQVLQAYALQHYLDLCGHDAYIIDYKAGALERSCPAFNQLARIKWRFKMLPLLKQYVQRKHDKRESLYNSNTRHFVEFRKKYIKYTKVKYETFCELQKNTPVADVYITGSDQTLSRCVPNSLVYMLGFVDSSYKKIAYAASFGRKSLQPFEIKDYRRCLAEYSAIGVREDTGVGICQSLGLDSAVFVPDPTILLKPENWRALSDGHNPFRTDKKKVFIYCCYMPLDAFVDKYSDMEDFEIVIASVGDNCMSERVSELSLESWIAAIDNADYVITNSFHATMFSLYLNTKFVVFGYTGNGSAMNARLESILPMVNLRERFQSLSKKPSDVLDVLRKDIDWGLVNTKLVEMRSVGEGFLKKNI